MCEEKERKRMSDRREMERHQRLYRQIACNMGALCTWLWPVAQCTAVPQKHFWYTVHTPTVPCWRPWPPVIERRGVLHWQKYATEAIPGREFPYSANTVRRYCGFLKSFRTEMPAWHIAMRKNCGDWQFCRTAISMLANALTCIAVGYTLTNGERDGCFPV